MSSFGSPGLRPPTKPAPPQRGSFPLDHDGECRDLMKNYLACIKKVRGVNEDECRGLAKSYLSCRMDRNLMAKDEFKNLGFQDAPGANGSQQKPSAELAKADQAGDSRTGSS
ncbi:unnamed protein product [Clonostachys rosea f. rosea IK726]|uniref:CHCH domain-containing protein n=2 Tax=Bionectria ochroleuca TaxID=29856 RepID=A0A0B7KJB8_BIOOC|nr:unnamed protein product [Clonostachys rosea f. rosea IK726]